MATQRVDLGVELRTAIREMETYKRRCDTMEAAALQWFTDGPGVRADLPGNPEGLADAWLRTDGDYKAATARYRFYAERVRTLTAAIKALREGAAHA